MHIFPRSTALIVSLAATTPVMAEEFAALINNENAIIITGSVEGYRAIDTTSGTKTSTPILDVPQAIAVLTSQQLRDQAILTISDAVRSIPGVIAGQGEGHRDQITLRGNNSTADFFVDGLRDDVQYFRSLYNIDRVEVHKGPNAMIFGRGGGGGVLNRISKGALLDETVLSGGAALNSFGSWTVNSDINIPFGQAAVRLNAFYENLNNHRTGFGGDRYGINPVVGVQLNERVKFEVSYEYANDSRVVDRGIPSINGAPAAAFKDFIFGDTARNQSDFESHAFRFRGEGKISDSLKVTVQALYGDYDKVYVNNFAATPIVNNTVGIEAYRDPTTRQNFIGQTNLEWRGATGGIDHIILFGAEYTAQNSKNERINGFFDRVVLSSANRRRSVNVTNPIIIPPFFLIPGAAGNSNRAVTSKLIQYSVYLQDQISLGDKIDIIAGLRYDRFDLGITNRFTAQLFNRAENLWSPRIGFVFKPIADASLYASYAKSYLPQSGDQFLSLDLTSALLAPETFDNYELGAKWDITPALSATLAAYRLDRGNTRAAGAIAGSTVLTGAQRSSGIEFSLNGKVMDAWQISVGYANTKAEIIRTTTAAPNGRRVAQVPRHQISLWNRYDINEKIGLGLGLYHQSAQFATISNAVRLPAFTRVDAAAYYAFSDSIKAQINIENLFDTDYFPVAHNDNNISPGAPLNARLSLSVSF